MEMAIEIDVVPYADACVDWKVVLRTCRNHQHCHESRRRRERIYFIDAVQVVALGLALADLGGA